MTVREDHGYRQSVICTEMDGPTLENKGNVRLKSTNERKRERSKIMTEREANSSRYEGRRRNAGPWIKGRVSAEAGSIQARRAMD